MIVLVSRVQFQNIVRITLSLHTAVLSGKDTETKFRIIILIHLDFFHSRTLDTMTLTISSKQLHGKIKTALYCLQFSCSLGNSIWFKLQGEI